MKSCQGNSGRDPGLPHWFYDSLKTPFAQWQVRYTITVSSRQNGQKRMFRPFFQLFYGCKSQQSCWGMLFCAAQ
ncbi:MAG: hypothetical protein LBD18_03395, partial [Treponema sp.]|nr:hypothetical protein [Treponema sp.]